MKAIKYFILSILLLSTLGQLLAQTCLSDPALKNLKAPEHSWCLETNGYYIHTLKFSPDGQGRIDFAIDVAENEIEEDDLIPFKRNFDVNNGIVASLFALILVYILHHLKKRLAFRRLFSFSRSYPRYLFFEVIRI
jgi:hypothetical protein